MTRWELRRVDMRRLSFSPTEIVGKGRPRMDTRSRRTYTPAKTRRAEDSIRREWRNVHGEDMAAFADPVVVRVAYTRPLAKSNPKYWAGRSDLGKPDADNVLKLVLDALNGLAFSDDAHIISLHIEKFPRSPHGNQPHMDITVIYYKEVRHEDSQG